jgi:hypothetical protein
VIAILAPTIEQGRILAQHMGMPVGKTGWSGDVLLLSPMSLVRVRGSRIDHLFVMGVPYEGEVAETIAPALTGQVYHVTRTS